MEIPSTIIMDKREDNPKIPDPVKGWDIQNVLQLADKLDKNGYILNTGAFNDYSLLFLYEKGFKNLIGIDLNQNIIKQVGYTNVKYMVNNMYNTHYPSHIFDAIISISTVEHSHGVEDVKRFLNEAKRLLRPNGILYMSTDYNETKINTMRYKIFNLPWNIFSKDEIREILDYMEKIGFEVDKNIPSQTSKLVHWNRKDYTFLAIIARLRADVPDNMKKQTDGVSLFVDTYGFHEGISEYTKMLAYHFQNNGYEVLINERKKGYPVIYEYHPGITATNFNPETDILDNHGNSGITGKHIIVHDTELHYTDNYYVIPHIEYLNTANVKVNPKQIICSFGFGFKFKRFDLVEAFASKLSVPAKILVSVNQITPSVIAPKSAKIGYWEYNDLLNELSECGVVVFAYDNKKTQVSGAMRLATTALGIPAVSITKSYQAYEAQLPIVDPAAITKEELFSIKPSNIFKSSKLYIGLVNEFSNTSSQSI
ncbi:methyltransferase domain-containing protein [Sulfolobus tengchongensis]|uniref:Methyltransferase domain-containing protein n=1 Tax=Sulfolobus tengchongensis TaxID=207809 RepID=A0AAX4KZW8_9CREN